MKKIKFKMDQKEIEKNKQMAEKFVKSLTKKIIV